MPSPLRFRFRDNNGGFAFSRVWIPDGATLAGVDAFAQGYANAVNPLTDAQLIDAKYKLSYEYANPSPAAIGSDVYSRLIAIFRNGDQYASISIPSALELPYDVDGPYRDIRLSFPPGAVSPVLTSLQSIVLGTVTPIGGQFPSTYLVGGLSRGVL